MYITKLARALDLDVTTTEAVRRILNTRLTKRNSHELIDSAEPLVIGLTATCLVDEDLKLHVYPRILSRMHWAQTNLYLNTTFTAEDLKNTYGYTVDDWIRTRVANTSLSVTNQIPHDGNHIYILQNSQGHTNVKNFFKKWGVKEIPNTIGPQKVLTYRTEKDLYILLKAFNNAAEAHETFKSITGWLPILLKDTFNKAISTDSTLYTYFKNCYDNKAIDYASLRNMPCIKTILEKAKKVQIESALNALNARLTSQLASEIDNTKADIHNIEEEHRNLLTTLKTLELKHSAGECIKDIDLLTQMLVNNPNVKEFKTSDRSLYLTTFGPVEYDKDKITTTIKRMDAKFIKVMSSPKVQLYWEARCYLDLTEYRIKSLRDNYNNLPNIHWWGYQCFGDNKMLIQKALKERDYLSALALTITAAQLLNIYDMTVMSKLYHVLEDTTHKPFLNKETGEFIGYFEAINLIKEDV